MKFNMNLNRGEKEAIKDAFRYLAKQNPQEAEDIQNQIQYLDAHKNYVFVDMDLLEKVRRALNKKASLLYAIYRKEDKAELRILRDLVIKLFIEWHKKKAEKEKAQTAPTVHAS